MVNSTMILDYNTFKEKFLGIFNQIANYTIEEEEKLKSKLASKLIKLKTKLTQQLKEIDSNNTGFINFIQLRKIFENIKINLSDDLLEYLIHLMKKFKHSDANSLEDLKYEVILNLNVECGESY